MTRIKIKELVWDDFNREHIKKHNVTVEEAEVAVKNLIAHKRAKKGKYLALGRSGSRILAIIGKEKTGIYYPATARDADKPERRIVYEKEKNK